jgi:hypothetical protein
MATKSLDPKVVPHGDAQLSDDGLKNALFVEVIHFGLAIRAQTVEKTESNQG